MTPVGGQLAAFDNPPVVEKAVGVEFSPLARWGVPHFGLYWSEINDEYPKFDVQPPLPSQIEAVDQAQRGAPGLTIEFGDPSRVRCWFLHRSDSQLLQLQDNRLILNWRRLRQDEEYPHYKTFLPVFQKEWQRFGGFLKRNQFEEPSVVQCELTYVNHVARGEGWKDFGDLPRVTTLLAGTPKGLPVPESIALNARFNMPEQQGRLHIALQPAIRNADGKEVLQVTLTVRGAPRGSGIENLVQWFDEGHKRIVAAFTEVTTPEMHKLWKRSR